MSVRISYVLTIVLLLAAMVLSVGYGEIPISYSQVWSYLYDVIIGHNATTIAGDAVQYVRLPHSVMAFLIGAGLSLTGLVMQTVMQNDLADPYLLGISSGANLGAVLAIVFGFTTFGHLGGVGLAAFIGAFSAACLILAISSMMKRIDAVTMLLIGFGLNACITGFVSLVITIVADTSKTKSIQYWLLGNLQNVNGTLTSVLAIAMGLGFLFFMSQCRILDMMLLGEELSITMGRNLATYRKIYIVIVSVLVGITVYASGIIGFVGLVIPHIGRRIVGQKHRQLIPLVMLIGGTFLMWADAIGRNIISGMALPIGISAAVCGAPLFLLFLLIRRAH